MRDLAHESRTLVFYESVHRIRECCEDLRESFGAQREARLLRELTKLYETALGDTLEAICARLDEDSNQQRGEFVLVIAGASDEADDKLVQGRRVYALLREELPPAQAAKLAAAISGAPRKALYQSGGE